MVLGKLPEPGCPTIWMIVGQGPIALAVGEGGGCLDIFTLPYLFSSLSPSLWETARYRLKYCIKGPLNPKQPPSQPTQRTRKYNMHYNHVRGDVLWPPQGTTLAVVKINKFLSVISFGSQVHIKEFFTLHYHFSYLLPLSGDGLI